ncbi:MAG: hypothetical protein Q8Q09_04950 [Deltaproteobacteria bacterium]|nr:hypothetical protein [Deltaproteobacteria bacterium]
MKSETRVKSVVGLWVVLVSAPASAQVVVQQQAPAGWVQVQQQGTVTGSAQVGVQVGGPVVYGQPNQQGVVVVQQGQPQQQQQWAGQQGQVQVQGWQPAPLGMAPQVIVDPFGPGGAPQQDQWSQPQQAGQVWIAGRWEPTPQGRQWVPGHWEMPPQQGYVWVEPEWSRRGNGWGHRRGYWSRPQNIGQQWLQPGAFGLQTQVRPYQVGHVITGMLGQGSFHRQEGGFADDYAVYLQAGQPVTFVVTGGQAAGQSNQLLDVVASIHFQGQELASDDDGAGFPHARLMFTPRVTGVYALRVTSYGSRFEQGTYSVQSWAGMVAQAQPFGAIQGWQGQQGVVINGQQPIAQPVMIQPAQPQTINVEIPQPQPQPRFRRRRWWR